MAIKRDSRYPGRWAPANADFPLGGPKNRTTDTSKDGSYFARDFMADYEAFFQRLMTEAGIMANELPDTAPTSQFFEALSSLIVPVGFTMYSTLSAQPVGRWIKGNGAALSRATYADLFAAASASSNYVSQSLKDADPETYAGYYGDGDGSTTFTLPDLRAEIIRGFDDGRGVDAGRGFGSWQIGSYLPGDDGFNNQIISVYRSENKGQLGWDEFPDSGRILSGTVTYSPATLTPLSPVTSHGGMSRPRNIAYTAWIRY